MSRELGQRGHNGARSGDHFREGVREDPAVASRVSDKAQEPTQETPKGYEIPVPKRETVMDALRKLVQPEKKP